MRVGGLFNRAVNAYDRRERRRRDPIAQTASLEDVIALSWVTKMYARHGTDEDMETLYHRWHFGHWRVGDPCTYRDEDGDICGL